VPLHYPRIGICAAAGRQADDELERFSGVKSFSIVSVAGARKRQQNGKRKCCDKIFPA